MSRKNSFVLIIMIIGTFFGVMCSTMTNLALPVLMKVFNISSSRVQWVSNGYVLVNAIMIPVSAYLIKKYSYRFLFIFFTALFGVGTLTGALANSFPILVAGRMIQAMGTGIMMPLVNVMAMVYAKKGQQGRVMGLVGLAFNFSPIVGPSVAGVILDRLNWRFLFILILPFTLATLIFSFILMPNIAKKEKPQFNYLGLITCSLGLWFLLDSFSNFGTAPLTSFRVLYSFIIGLVLLIAFVVTQWPSDHPFVNLRVFKNQQFKIAVIVNCLLVATMYGNTILLPLLVQDVMRQSAFISGLVILPGAISTGILSPLSGKLFDRYPVRWMVTYGLIVDLFGTAMQAFVGVNANAWFAALWQWVRQFGIVMILIPLQTQALAMTKPKLLPDAVATFNTTRMVAASFGMAFVVAMVNVADSIFKIGISARGIAVGFMACFVILVLALIFAQFLRTNRQQMS